MSNRDPVMAIGRDPDALEAFYREHLESVQRYVARRVGTPEEAADLTADIFLAVIEASSRYRGDGAAPLAWLYGIARNVVADRYRSVARSTRAAQRIEGRALLDEDATDRIVARLDDQRAARAVVSSLESLPASQRAVVELVAVDGLTLTEAATALGITAGNARIRYHRARRRLAFTLTNPHEVTP